VSSYSRKVKMHDREQEEHRIFKRLIDMVPDLEVRLVEGTVEDATHVAKLVGVFDSQY
jgi:hypothetical protein